jgi:uncharacterized protein YdaU (DUF1376 family)
MTYNIQNLTLEEKLALKKELETDFQVNETELRKIRLKNELKEAKNVFQEKEFGLRN